MYWFHNVQLSVLHQQYSQILLQYDITQLNIDVDVHRFWMIVRFSHTWVLDLPECYLIFVWLKNNSCNHLNFFFALHVLHLAMVSFCFWNLRIIFNKWLYVFMSFWKLKKTSDLKVLFTRISFEQTECDCISPFVKSLKCPVDRTQILLTLLRSDVVWQTPISDD